MAKKHLLTASILLILALLSACVPIEEVISHTQQPPSPTPGSGGDPGETTLEGVSCPESFQTKELVKKNITINTGGTLKLCLGSTPSMPCGWGKPELSQAGVIEQVGQYRKWPAEGVTPAPGAPGKEIWVYQAQEEGKTTLTLPCYCLNEEGSQEQLEGRLEVKIQVQK